MPLSQRCQSTCFQGHADAEGSPAHAAPNAMTTRNARARSLRIRKWQQFRNGHFHTEFQFRPKAKPDTCPAVFFKFCYNF
jgi:hypothetical protein